MRVFLILMCLDTIVSVNNNHQKCNILNILQTEKEHCLETLASNINVSEMENHKAGLIYRNCTSEGWSDIFPVFLRACGYDVNDTTDEIKTMNFMNMKIVYTIGYSISLISLSIAIAILGLFRNLHCTRNYIHLHLFVSYMLRGISIFIKDHILFSSKDADHCHAYSVECKYVLVFFQYCIVANFSWLLVEALYLHTLLVISVFSEHKYFWRFIILGWGGPAVFIVPWAIARRLHENTGCWDVNSNEHIWWIIKGPVIGSIFISFALFVHIIKILLKKLKTSDVRNEFTQYKRLAKSTFLLIPLFGVYYIIFVIFPENNAELAMNLRMCFELFLGSFQGFAVSVLYCFLNDEVQTEIKRKWRQWKQEKYFAVDLHKQRNSTVNSEMTGGTQLSLLTSSSYTEQEFIFQEAAVL
ncbi:secretin receptor isoform X2 [Narcine bancroftii]|uniref:secretin receptor isoform X2 n=1 Tax=Narcine bancroftii TaxID=1343680 RepID=UPI0038318913